jgi:predicted ArsR family transcriptional regulator
MSSGQEILLEAKALGDPTRYRIFSYIAAAVGPVSVAELTAEMGLNHNAIRQHLAVLKSAGLVREDVEDRSRPGRPRLLYRISPEAQGKWGVPGAYEWLSELLARAVREKVEVREVGRREGRRIASGLAVDPADPLSAMEQEIARRGFRPRRHLDGSQVELVLERCPFALVAKADPGVICPLHLGLAEGLAEGVGGLEVAGLVPRDPSKAGCSLVLWRVGDRQVLSN